MNVFELTRALVDIESVTGNEEQVGEYLFAHLSSLAAKHAGQAERQHVEPGRFNVLATWGKPLVTLSTHMDTVPPFFPSSENVEFIRGRGACDAKGIIAAMIAAAEVLLDKAAKNFALLFVVGEERNGAGAIAASKSPCGSRYLINGEPTENLMALGSKGSLRYELVARGRLAHSAYPELGHSAIETLLDVLHDIRRIPLPEDALLGRSTLNIGTLSGGRAPNVIADHAQADLLFRLVGDAAPIRAAVTAAVAGRAEAREVVHSPALRLEAFDAFRTTVVSFTTDIPSFAGTWGRPFLIGPGSIQLAHTAEERVTKKQLLEAVEIYARLVKSLVAAAEGK
jgi:acetylornithine deacetylase